MHPLLTLQKERHMQLYGRRSSINVQKVLWTLGELGRIEGRDYERIDAGLQFGIVDTPEYLKLNPNGLVPTLIDGDVVSWESNSVVRYLAACDENHALLPTDPKARADVERWMDWQLASLWAALRVAFIGLTRTPEPERNYGAIKKAYDEGSRLLAIADAVLARQPFLAASGLSVADIVVALCVHRWVDMAETSAEKLGERPALPSLIEWYERLAARPAFKAAIS
jgi:glutathione S-transferase